MKNYNLIILLIASSFVSLSVFYLQYEGHSPANIGYIAITETVHNTGFTEMTKVES